MVPDETEAERFRKLGLEAVVDRSVPAGLDLAATVLLELGQSPEPIETWMRRYQERALTAMNKPIAA